MYPTNQQTVFVMLTCRHMHFHNVLSSRYYAQTNYDMPKTNATLSYVNLGLLFTQIFFLALSVHGY
jgi:hypothetical protein